MGVAGGNTGDETKRVLVVSSDVRVAGALASLLSSVPDVDARTGAPGAVEDAVRTMRPHLAVVDVTRTEAPQDLQLLSRLARRLPVVAVCDCAKLRADILARGVVGCCEKDGDADALTAAVLDATHAKARRAPGPAVRGAIGPAVRARVHKR